MKNEGKVFEKNWKDSMPNTVYYQRIKDSTASFGMDSTSTRFTLNNPYDTFIFYNYRLFTIELKSTKASSVSIQKDKSEKGKMIKINQIEGLLEASKYDGIYSGFLIDFRSSNNTYFLNIIDFKNFIDNSDKKSINEKDVIGLNSIIVKKEKKRIHYKYDVIDLLEKIKGDLK